MLPPSMLKYSGCLRNEHRLRFPVTALLPQIRRDRRAPVMPDKPRRTKTDAVSPPLQSPADIHVIPGPVKDRIEPADFHQRPFVKGHVATGDVFSLPVSKHDVRRSARRNHHRCRDRRIFRRQKIVPADSYERSLHQIAHQVIQPVLIRTAIRVRKRDYFSVASKYSRVARHRESLVFLADVSELLVERGHLRRDVSRTVIHHNYLVTGIIEPDQ